MRKLTAILCLSVSTMGAFAQGLVTLANNPQTLISAGPIGSGTALAAGAAGNYYFGLLISPTAFGPFTFSGNSAQPFELANLISAQDSFTLS